MRRLLFSLTMLTILMSSSFSVPIPANIRITNIPQLNNEEQVWICPTDSNVIIANWRDFRLGYRQVGIGRSSDGGATWTDSLIDPFYQYFSTSSWQSDPTLVVDASGTFIMSVLDYVQPTSNHQSVIAFYRSTDKGLNWTGPVAHNPALGLYFEDKQFLAVDRTGGPHDGNLYCAWARFDNPTRIMFVRSTDGALTFDDTLIVGPTENTTCFGVIDAGQFACPTVNSDGSVHVFWQGFYITDTSTCTGSSGIKHVKSTDGGVSFTTPDVILPVSGYWSANGNIQTYSQPVADCDISGGPFDGNIYVMFTNSWLEDTATGSRSDVDFIRSTDNGATWSDRLQVNDDSNSGNMDNFHPWMIVNEEGVIVSVFYDQRFDPPFYLNFDLLAAYSFDGGLTFTTNHRISSVSSSPGSLNPENLPRPNTKPGDLVAPLAATPMAGVLGEYIGVSAFHDKVTAVWTDTRNGNSEVYNANWYLQVLPPRLVVPAEAQIVAPQSPFTWATSWKQNQDHYRIEISANSLFSGPVITRTTDSNIYALDIGQFNGTYYWRVKAFDLVGGDSSEYSAVHSYFVDGTPPTLPILISPPNQDTVNTATPSFDWTDAIDPSPITYRLLISTDSTFQTIPLYSYPGLTGSDFVIPDSLADNVTYYWRVEVEDALHYTATTSSFGFTVQTFICGDCNNNGGINVLDLNYLVAYFFTGGPPPPIPQSADVNQSGNLNVLDLNYLVAFFFNGGPTPNCP